MQSQLVVVLAAHGNGRLDGAGGGGLAWMNGIEVTPGEMLEIAVGLGRQSESNTSSYGGGNSYLRRTATNPTKNQNDCIIFAGGAGYQPTVAIQTVRLLTDILSKALIVLIGLVLITLVTAVTVVVLDLTLAKELP